MSNDVVEIAKNTNNGIPFVLVTNAKAIMSTLHP